MYFQSGIYRDAVGDSARIIGDTDGDGYDEIAIGVTGADEGLTNNGATWIFGGG